MGIVELLKQSDRMLGSNLRWTSIPSTGNNNTFSRFCNEIRVKRRNLAMSQLGLKVFTFYLTY